VEDLRRALGRQLLISGIRENLDRIQKQVSLLSQGVADPGGATVRPRSGAIPSTARVITRQTGELRQLSDAAGRPAVDRLAGAYAHWEPPGLLPFRNLGVNYSQPSRARIRADPIGQDVLQSLLPDCSRKKKKRVTAAGVRFNAVAWIIDLLTILIFAASTLVRSPSPIACRDASCWG